ncbi:hypothetical protein MNEG_10157 [Monoraphidium neglectum]|uniref:Uncharacterized protein n=1 Tax=Monoraphidium neglectum TaxID=145388 RepID=A0A0D2MTP1_9CHLO|nr:hypothetical protein MNEG_10157 [Monoraphidium neglectum]KIY97805.1 hypothetical protein MNEG_10157 [Monoraphidium neglectum]|eukprot:XP_013896825.1 hypothetical protein MNEG_10157 [Monoraphidium neglectum]
MILVAGSCVMESPRSGGAGAASAEHVVVNLDGASVHGGSARVLAPGDPLAEMAFFTETANLQAVRTACVCRVLSLSRTAYLALAAAFPISAERVLGNLLEAAEEMVEREMHLPFTAFGSLEANLNLEALSVKYASPELYRGSSAPLGRSGSGAAQGPALDSAARGGGDDGGGIGANGGGGGGGGGADEARDAFDLDGLVGSFSDRGQPLRQSQRMALSNLVRVRMLVEAQKQKLQRERTAEFLEAAKLGNMTRLRAMLQQGLSPDSSDYDGRTALMLAAGQGHLEAVKLLLSTGAHPSLTDSLQGCALLEAARGGHDHVLSALLAAGAKMYMSQVACAAHLCTAVFEGDVKLLRRLVRAGMPPDSGDYDGRRAAHIAAAESSLAALKVLVEEGGASLEVKDRWGLTPLDEARRGGAAAAVAYLERLLGLARGGGDDEGRVHHGALGASV